jgi:hypothetical protein
VSTTICPGCANPVSESERLTGRCGKDGFPLDALRGEVRISGEALGLAQEKTPRRLHEFVGIQFAEPLGHRVRCSCGSLVRSGSDGSESAAVWEWQTHVFDRTCEMPPPPRPEYEVSG